MFRSSKNDAILSLAKSVRAAVAVVVVVVVAGKQNLSASVEIAVNRRRSVTRSRCNSSFAGREERALVMALQVLVLTLPRMPPMGIALCCVVGYGLHHRSCTQRNAMLLPECVEASWFWPYIPRVLCCAVPCRAVPCCAHPTTQEQCAMQYTVPNFVYAAQDGSRNFNNRNESIGKFDHNKSLNH